jgi:hypothetical protein
MCDAAMYVHADHPPHPPTHIHLLQGGYGTYSQKASSKKEGAMATLDRSNLANNCCAHIQALVDPLRCVMDCEVTSFAIHS